MARRRQPDDETPTARRVREMMEVISTISPRPEKVAWNRQQDNMAALLAQVEPIYEQIRELHAQKQPLMDQIERLRARLVAECVHPYDMLTYDDAAGVVVCKFCNARFNMPVREGQD